MKNAYQSQIEFIYKNVDEIDLTKNKDCSKIINENKRWKTLCKFDKMADFAHCPHDFCYFQFGGSVIAFWIVNKSI